MVGELREDSGRGRHQPVPASDPEKIEKMIASHKLMRLPLVTLGLLPTPDDRTINVNKKRPLARKQAPRRERIKAKSAQFGSNCLFRHLPEELCLKILSEYIDDDKDLLAMRATCHFAQLICTKIFSERKVYHNANGTNIKVAATWGKSLTEIHVAEYHLVDADLCAIARGCQKLAVFTAGHWGNVSPYGLGMFFSFLNQLEKVEITQCPALNDWALTRLAERCPKLRALQISGPSEVSHNGIAALAAHSTLEEINVSSSDQFDDECLKALLLSKKAKFRSMTLSGCRSLSANALRLVGSSCPHLEVLDLSETIGVGDSVCLSIAKGCKKLTSISLSGCSSVKAGVSLLVSFCSVLERLDLSRCERLSDICFLCLNGTMENVKYVNITGCAGVSARGLQAMRSHFPSAELLYPPGLDESTRQCLPSQPEAILNIPPHFSA